MKIGILGCGVISNTYIQEIKRIYPGLLEIEAVADVDIERAKMQADKYQIPYACTMQQLLANTEIEMVVNLTPPKAHAGTNLQILEAGKHVFCEKPFALTVEEAEKIADLAKRKGLSIGAAPDTFMTAPMQDCRRILEAGWIGKPLYVTANMMSCGVETWHPSPAAFYQKGGGPLYDMAGYYLSVLIHLFGPVAEVFAYGAKGFEKRQVYSRLSENKSVDVEVPTHYTAVMRMQNGILVNMNMSFDIWHSTLPKMEIYGTEGTMTMPDPNMSDGQTRIFRKEQVLGKIYGLPEDDNSYLMPPLGQRVAEYTRGSGVAELALAVSQGRKNIANVEIAIHILDVIEGIMEASEKGICVKMRTSCEQPQSWDWVKEIREE